MVKFAERKRKIMTNRIIKRCDLWFAILIIAFTSGSAGLSNAQVSTGGDFSIEQKVIAGGGGFSTDSTTTIYRVEGTLGQSAAGTQMSGGPFTQRGGFWNPFLTPTAATVSVRGQVVGPNEVGVQYAFVTLIGGPLTVPKTAKTNNFGRFRFDDLQVGFFYIMVVRAKGYTFKQDTLVFTLNDELNGLVFNGFQN